MQCAWCWQPIGAADDRLHYARPHGTSLVLHLDYHLVCGVLGGPVEPRDLDGYAELPVERRALLDRIATDLVATSTADDDIRVIWRDRTRVRCVLHLRGRYVLYCERAVPPPLVVEGTLREVVACVPDDDFDAATAAMAAAERGLPARIQLRYGPNAVRDD